MANYLFYCRDIFGHVSVKFHCGSTKDSCKWGGRGFGATCRNENLVLTKQEDVGHPHLLSGGGWAEQVPDINTARVMHIKDEETGRTVEIEIDVKVSYADYQNFTRC